jgi:L-lactate utilization protein LutC
MDRRMAHASETIRPKLSADLFTHFTEKLVLGSGTLEQVDGMSNVSDAIVRFLRMNDLALKVRVAPSLKTLSWQHGLEVSYGNTRGDDMISVTPAFCAVAETGSVVLLSSEDNPTSLNFLPDVHIVIVEMNQLVPHYEDVWIKLRDRADMPRTVNFITGPSKTADVEQTLQIGAHGPRQLHVVMVGKNSQ